MDEMILRVENLSLSLGDFALKNVNLELPKGVIMGLIGRNGMGKTTLIKALIDQLEIQSGEVIIDGITYKDDNPEIRNKVAVVLEETVSKEFKPDRMAKMKATFFKDYDFGKYQNLMDKFNLDRKKKLKKYSKGMKMEFNIINALCQNSELLILDEPMEGLDPVARVEVIELLQEFMQNENNSILISTHIISDIEDIVDYIAFIKDGEITEVKEKNTLIEENTIVFIPKGEFKEEYKQAISGIKESIFGYEGLTKDKRLFENINGVIFKTPKIEEIFLCNER